MQLTDFCVCNTGNDTSEAIKTKASEGAPSAFPFLEMDQTAPGILGKFRDADDRTETDSSTSKCSGPRRNYPYQLSDVHIVKTIGSGRFGFVQLGLSKQGGKLLLLNSYQKSILVDTCQQHIPLREKDILEELRHPFISTLLGCVQDDSNLYMISEAQLGGDLSRLLMTSSDRSSQYFKIPQFVKTNEICLSDNHKAFYAACVTSVLKYCHSKNIILRGLHPDTLYIDSDGYLKVTDWGFAKRIHENTFTLCGHVEYLCPEAVLSDSGYGKGADYWALGILIYEMLAGRSPFVVRTNSEHGTGPEAGFDDASTVENIISGNISYPEYFSTSARSIIGGLCQKNPAVRLGCVKTGRGIRDVTQHPWFSSIDWDKLEKKELRAPWVPDVQDSNQLKYFGDGVYVDVSSSAPFDGYDHPEWKSFCK